MNPEILQQLADLRIQEMISKACRARQARRAKASGRVRA
jgi:hypothetical protein